MRLQPRSRTAAAGVSDAGYKKLAFNGLRTIMTVQLA